MAVARTVLSRTQLAMAIIFIEVIENFNSYNNETVSINNIFLVSKTNKLTYSSQYKHAHNTTDNLYNNPSSIEHTEIFKGPFELLTHKQIGYIRVTFHRKDGYC